jgi:hypothetical protein
MATRTHGKTQDARKHPRNPLSLPGVRGGFEKSPRFCRVIATMRNHTVIFGDSLVCAVSFGEGGGFFPGSFFHTVFKNV